MTWKKFAVTKAALMRSGSRPASREIAGVAPGNGEIFEDGVIAPPVDIIRKRKGELLEPLPSCSIMMRSGCG